MASRLPSSPALAAATKARQEAQRERQRLLQEFAAFTTKPGIHGSPAPAPQTPAERPPSPPAATTVAAAAAKETGSGISGVTFGLEKSHSEPIINLHRPASMTTPRPNLPAVATTAAASLEPPLKQANNGPPGSSNGTREPESPEPITASSSSSGSPPPSKQSNGGINIQAAAAVSRTTAVAVGERGGGAGVPPGWVSGVTLQDDPMSELEAACAIQVGLPSVY